MEAVTFGIRKARQLCKEWQAILGLQDWKVTVHVVRRSEMQGENEGECQYVLPRKRATIWLCDAVDRHDSEDVDMEADLVHELLHIPFGPFFCHEEQDRHINLCQEQCIDMLADALVRLKRSE